jgi:hypothetical protein
VARLARRLSGARWWVVTSIVAWSWGLPSGTYRALCRASDRPNDGFCRRRRRIRRRTDDSRPALLVSAEPRGGPVDTVHACESRP